MFRVCSIEIYLILSNRVRSIRGSVNRADAVWVEVRDHLWGNSINDNCHVSSSHFSNNLVTECKCKGL